MDITVGLFNDSYPPVMDGVANTVKNYAYWLNKKFGKSYVITPKFPKYIDNDEFEVIRYASTKVPLRPPYRLGMPMLAFHSKRKLRSIDFDILHVHSPFSSGQLGLKIAHKKNIPIIATFHSKYYEDFKEALKNDFLAKIAVKRIVAYFKKVDYVWTMNNSTAETLLDYGFNKKIEIMPNGTDFTANIDDIKNSIYMEKHYHIQKDELVFLFVGQHIWQKNMKLMVQSLSLMKKNHLKFKMFFIGEGVAKNDLEIMVENNGLTDNVHFMGKISDRHLLKRFFARADLFLFPSTYDTSGIVVSEAAALKTPSIVIDGSNAQEGIIDGINGFTCQENVESLATKVIQVSKDRTYLSNVGLKAQETISLTWESVIDRVNTRYQEIILEHHDKQKNRIYLKNY